MIRLKFMRRAILLFVIHFVFELAAEGPFRPENGKFPPLEKAHSYRGELVFVDHVNRRGSIRVQSTGMFWRNNPNPFAMLPYGMIRYHGAPADLRDIPLGTILHVKAFLPPDPKLSSVPILPINNREIDGNHYRGVGTEPAENHVLLLEDEFSYCQRENRVWKLKEVELKNETGTMIASLESKDDGNGSEEKMTFDAGTRIWRGRELLSPKDLIGEGVWPVEGKASLASPLVMLGLIYKPTPDGVFNRFHVSDLWLDDIAMQRATHHQTEIHKTFIRSRWMPAWIDAVEYGKFGHATVIATLFGGMDPSLYADFQKGLPALMNGAELTLKHTGGGYGPAHMASGGTILEVTKIAEEIPLGSSGIQIRFETDLIIEGIRTGRVVRVRPKAWTAVQLPREECIWDSFTHEDRFPTPAIFPKYSP